MFYFVVSVYIWIVFIITSIVCMTIAFIIWCLTVPFDPNLRIMHKFSCLWASIYIWVNPLWKLQIEGREKIQPGKAYVMVCNHQSMLDILVLYQLFTHFKWVSKAELFKVPIVGWNMYLNRYIAVNRANKASHIQMMKECEMNLLNGNSIMIFPEGTRSKDGVLLPFKEGAFRIAQSAKVDILPILLDGSANTLPKQGIMLRSKETIRIKVLDPIEFSTFAELPVKEIASNVQEMMSEILTKKMRQK